MSKFFCAICAADIHTATPRQAPLGRKGALVNVCIDCDDEPAREVQGPDRMDCIATCLAGHTWDVVIDQNPPRRDAQCPKCERLAIKYVAMRPCIECGRLTSDAVPDWENGGFAPLCKGCG